MPSVRVSGRGAVELPGYGVADAEHRLEKELAAALPTATLRIEEIRRRDPAPRIVEEYEIRFRLTATFEVEETDEEKRVRAAFAAGREALRGTRFEKVAWEKPV